MPQPKKKTSHQKQGMTRHHWKGELPNLSTCSNCKSAMLAHHACPTCGFYRGRKVVEVGS